MHDTALGWRLINPRMAERYSTESMGETAENVAERHEVSRADQDAFALRSHRRALAAQEAGPLRRGSSSRSRLRRRERGETVCVERDEGPRADTTPSGSPALRPVFREGGTVTAGNASTLNDGAACLVMASERRGRGSSAPSRSPGWSRPGSPASIPRTWGSARSRRSAGPSPPPGSSSRRST